MAWAVPMGGSATWGHWCGMQCWCGQDVTNNRSIGTVVTEWSCGELAQVFLVFSCEMQAELDKCLIGDGMNVPGVACHGEHACGL